MSLLVSTNLIDRIYMCADTRLSRYRIDNGKETTVVEHDNLQKIIVIAKPLVVIGCVGSPKLAGFIINKIQTEFTSTLYANQLKKVLSNNKDKIIGWIDEFITKNNVPYEYAKCVLVIAGQNPLCKRTVESKRLFDLTREYQKQSKEKINKHFGNKRIEDFSEDDLKRFIKESEDSQMSMKESLFQGIFNKNHRRGEIELNIPAQTLFALEIRAENYNKNEDIVIIKNYKWGETAVYGAGFGKEILTPDFFGYLDLRKGSGNYVTDIIPFASAIKDNFGGTIGGGMTNFILVNNEILTAANALHRINPDTMKSEQVFHLEVTESDLYHYIDGKKEKLINFNDFSKDELCNYLLSMGMV